ncbi:MAG: hypothetical protein WBX50_10770, partial [Candidatus Deferrimicrobiaceae bacterium]
MRAHAGKTEGEYRPIGPEDPSTERCHLKLYIAGMNQTARRTIRNLEMICAEHLEGRYTLKIID